MDFLDRLLDFIESKVDLDAPFSVGRLGTSENAYALRPSPSSPISRSLDKGKTYEYAFQILIKGTNQFKVIREMHEITKILDGLSNSAIQSEDGSFIFVKCEVYNYPSYLEEDRDTTTWTAQFVAELEGGN